MGLGEAACVQPVGPGPTGARCNLAAGAQSGCPVKPVHSTVLRLCEGRQRAVPVPQLHGQRRSRWGQAAHVIGFQA